MSEWRDIETAPKRIPAPGANLSMDRQEIILGWRGSKFIAFGCWEPDRDENGSWDQTGKGRWYAKNAPYAVPSHWMPLPDPPPPEGPVVGWGDAIPPEFGGQTKGEEG